MRKTKYFFVISLVLIVSNCLTGCYKQKPLPEKKESNVPQQTPQLSKQAPTKKAIESKAKKTRQICVKNDLKDMLAVGIDWTVKGNGRVINRGSYNKPLNAGSKIYIKVLDRPNTVAHIKASINIPYQRKVQVCEMDFSRATSLVKLSEIQKKGRCHTESLE